MIRREFITLVGGAAAWPLAARGQQPVMPVIGILSARLASDKNSETYAALRDGLQDAGFVEGRNISIEYRFAENRYERLPPLAAELVRLKVAVIFASGGGRAQPVFRQKRLGIAFGQGCDLAFLGHDRRQRGGRCTLRPVSANRGGRGKGREGVVEPQHRGNAGAG